MRSKWTKQSDAEYFAKRVLTPNRNLLEIAKRDEKHLLSLVIKHEDLMRRALDAGVTCRYFLTDSQADFFGLISDFFEHHHVLPSEPTLRSRLEAVLTDEKLISSALVNFQNLSHSGTTSRDDFNPLLAGLLERYISQRLYEETEAGQRLVDIIGKCEGQSSEVASLASDLADITAAMDIHTDNRNTGELDEFILSRILAERENPELMTDLLYCGMSSIDELFEGFRRGKYGCIIGPPHGGKTSMMMNMAHRMSLQYSVGYLCFEQSSDELRQRTLSMISGVPTRLFEHPTEMSIEDISSIRSAIKVETDVRYRGMTQGDSILKVISKLDMEHRKSPFDVVFVDYLDLISPERHRSDRVDKELSDVSQMLQGWARKNDVLLWTAQSYNNEIIKKLGKLTPQERAQGVGGEGIGGTQAIWRDSDYIVSIYPSEKDNTIWCTIIKARGKGCARRYIPLIINSGTGLIMPTTIEFDKPPQADEKEKMVMYDKQRDKYRYILNGKISGKRYDTADDALQARKGAE